MNPFGSTEDLTIEGVSVKIPILCQRKNSVAISFQKPV